MSDPHGYDGRFINEEAYPAPLRKETRPGQHLRPDGKPCGYLKVPGSLCTKCGSFGIERILLEDHTDE